MMTYDDLPEKQMAIILYKTTLNNQRVYGLESQIHQYLMAINWGLPRCHLPAFNQAASCDQ